MKECIVVLGMHRSGTSVLTGLLNILGNYAGTDMVAPESDNPKGFFENKKTLEVNERILNENGSCWSGDLFSAELVTPHKFDEYVHLAKNAILDQFNYAKKIVIKDPRICLLFPIWEKALISLNFEIKIILIYRNPIEVALSLKQRNDFTIELGLILWSQHFFESEKVSRSYERIFVEFNSDFLALDKLLIKLSNFSGVELTDTNKKTAKEFYTPRLKHQNLSLKNTSSSFPHYLTSISNLLISRDFDNSEKIDQLRKEFTLSQAFFLHDKKDTKYQIEVQQSKLNEQSSEINNHQEAISTLNSTIQSQELELKSQQNQLEKQLNINSTNQETINTLNATILAQEKDLASKDQLISKTQESQDNSVSIIKEQLDSVLKANTDAHHALDEERVEKVKLSLTLKEKLQINQNLHEQILKIEKEKHSLEQALIEKEADYGQIQLEQATIKKENEDTLKFFSNHIDDKNAQIKQSNRLVDYVLSSANRRKKYSRYIKNKPDNYFFIKIKGLLNNKKGRTFLRDKNLIVKSGMFDTFYYLTRNPDVLDSGKSPLDHFCVYGWKEQRNPSSDFDIKQYYENNPKLVTTEINPLVHYILYTK